MGSGRELRRLSMKKVKAKANLRKKNILKKKRKKVQAYSEDTVLAVALEEQRAKRAAKKLKDKEEVADGITDGHSNGELLGVKRKYWPGLKNVGNASTGDGVNKKTARSSRHNWDDTVKRLFESDSRPPSVHKERIKRTKIKKTVLSEATLQEETFVAAEAFKTRFHPTLRADDQADWVIGDEQLCAPEAPFKKNVDRFAKVVVNPRDCFFRSNLQTTAREVVKLSLSEEHLGAIKCTPFWFFVNSLLTEDIDMLLLITKKYEGDIRAIIRRFDHVDQVFRFGSKGIKLVKRDAVLMFGIVDGTDQILPQVNDYPVTPWMRRCFPDARFEGRNGRALVQLTKCQIYRNLQRLCSLEGPEHSKDVARTMHVYLMAALFMPNANTTIAWAVCEYLEEFEDICGFDWGNLIVAHLLDQMTKTTTMKVSGIAMLLPYFLCERTCLIDRRDGASFPRYLCWNLQALHVKLMCADMNEEWDKLVAAEALIPNLDEKVRFKRHREETENNPSHELGETQTIDIVEDGLADVSADIVEESEEFDEVIEPDVDSESSSPVEDSDRIETDIVGGSRGRKKLLSECEEGDALELGEKTPAGKSSMQPDLLDTPTRWCGSMPVFCDEDITDVVFDTPICAQGAGACVSRKSMTPPSCSLKFCSTLMNDKGGGPAETPVLTDADNLPLVEEVDRLKRALADSSILGDRLAEERDGLKRRLSARSASLTLLETQSEELQEAMEKLRRGMHDITVDYIRRVSDINVEIMILKEEWEAITIERESGAKLLKDQLEEVQKERVAKSEELVELKDCIGTLRLGWQEKEESLNNEIVALRKTVNDNQAVIDDLRVSLHALEEVQKERDAKEEDLVELKDCMATVRAGWKEKEALLNNEIYGLRKKGDDNQAVIDDLQVSLHALFGERDCIAGQLEAMINPTDTQILADPENQIKMDLASANGVLQRKLDDKDKENDELKQSILVKDEIIRVLKARGEKRIVSPGGMATPSASPGDLRHKDLNSGNGKADDWAGARVSEVGGSALNTKNSHGETDTKQHQPIPCQMIVPFAEHVDGGIIEAGIHRTPVRADQKQTLPKPGTAARAVKRRTEEESRKPKAISPVCQPVFRVMSGPSRSIVIQGQFVWNRSCPTICRAIGPVMERLRLAFKQPNDTVIWRGKGRYSQVTAEDALRVLHNEDMSAEIIDSWVEILLNMLSTKKPVRSSYVITSKLWDVMEKEECFAETCKYIYQQFREAVKEEIIIMPVTTPGPATDLRRDGNHWTMLKYNVKTACWVYHNSKVPPNGELDTHFKRCLGLRSKVEGIMKAALIANGRNTPLTNPVRGVKPMHAADLAICPQQRPHTRDSGVIVCHEIEKTLKRSGVGSIGKVDGGMYADSTSSYYRCRMIEGFCMPHTLE